MADKRIDQLPVKSSLLTTDLIVVEDGLTQQFYQASAVVVSGGAPVQSVAGKTGVVTLVKADVGLGNVDNTADTAKPISTAQAAVNALKANISGQVFTGAISAPNLSGSNTGDQTTITGNAGTATKLLTARTINGVSFDGTGNITVADGTKLYNLSASSTQTTSFTASINTRYSVDATSGAITVTLPATASLGNVLFIQKSDATTNIVTMSGNINGVAASSLPLRTQLQGKLLQWDGVSSWWVIAGDLSLPSLDSRYLQTSTGIAGYLIAGTNVTVTGAGTIASPYSISSTGGGGSAVWGGITGTLSSQTDLQTALTARVLKAGDTMTGVLNTQNVLPATTATYTLGAASFYYTDLFATKVNYNSTSFIQANGATLLGTTADFWGSRGFKFGTGAGTGTDPLPGVIAGVKGYVSGTVFALQPFQNTNDILQIRNSTGTVVTRFIGTGVLTPLTNNSTDIGTTSLYFANFYGSRYNLNSTAYFDGATAGTIVTTGTLKAPMFVGTNVTATSGQGTLLNHGNTQIAVTVPTGQQLSLISLDVRNNATVTADSNLYGLFIRTEGDGVDTGAAISVENNGKADGIYLGIKGKAGVVTTNTPSGIGLDLNRGASAGVENSSTFGGTGIHIWDFSTTDNGDNGAIGLKFSKENNLNTDHRLLYFRSNRRNIEFYTPEGTGYDGTKSIFRSFNNTSDKFNMLASGDTIISTPTIPLTLRNNADSASVQVGIFEGDRATITANDSAFLTYRLSNSAGTQMEAFRQTWRLASTTAGAESAQVFWGILNGGALSDKLILTAGVFAPVTSGGLTLGDTGLYWSSMYATTHNFNATASLGGATAGNIDLTGTLTANATSIITDTTTGLKIGTATTQRVGFFGAAPVVQQANNTELLTVLANLGLRATGSTAPLTISGVVQVNGSFRTSQTTNTAGVSLVVGGTGVGTTNYTQLCNAATAAFNVTLPATANNGYRFLIKKIDSSVNSVTIQTAGGTGTIDGASTYVLSTQYKYVTVESTGTSGVWYIVGNN